MVVQREMEEAGRKVGSTNMTLTSCATCQSSCLKSGLCFLTFGSNLGAAQVLQSAIPLLQTKSNEFLPMAETVRCQKGSMGGANDHRRDTYAWLRRKVVFYCSDFEGRQSNCTVDEVVG